jgi:Zn-dependent M28 family amino/carboxypeptidase
MVVLGAHVDHLGTGKSSSSLAHDDEAAGIHYGADDNASGVAAMIEIARWLAAQKSAGKLKLSHDIVFAAWSGEELGILGSSHFVRSLHPEGSDDRTTDVIAYLNMDMIGRYRDGLTVHGLASSPAWAKAIERANVPVGLTLHALPDTYLPTDSTPFYVAGVPILSAFTGAHEDYHRPSDTPDKLNYEATARIAQFMGHLTRHISTSADRPAYVAVKRNQQPQIRGGIRAYLGTVPDYAQGDVKGLKLSGVAKGGPAEKAGLQAGDIITRLAGRTIENIYDYTYAIEALKVGQPVELQLQRGTESRTLTITPESRD